MGGGKCGIALFLLAGGHRGAGIRLGRLGRLGDAHPKGVRLIRVRPVERLEGNVAHRRPLSGARGLGRCLRGGRRGRVVGDRGDGKGQRKDDQYEQLLHYDQLLRFE